MVMKLTQYGVAYFPIPKIACSSLKILFYGIENGEEFQPRILNGKTWHIHDAHPTKTFYEIDHALLGAIEKIAVIRDPVERLLSAYSNRVGYYKELRSAWLDKTLLSSLQIEPDPGPNDFSAISRSTASFHRR